MSVRTLGISLNRIDPRTMCSILLLTQSLSGILWWSCIIVDAQAWQLFADPKAPSSAFFAFVLPDLAIFVAASAVAAWGTKSGSRWAEPLTWLTIGGTLYAGMYCWALTYLSGTAHAAALGMSAAMLNAAVIGLLSSCQEFRHDVGHSRA